MTTARPSRAALPGLGLLLALALAFAGCSDQAGTARTTEVSPEPVAGGAPVAHALVPPAPVAATPIPAPVPPREDANAPAPVPVPASAAATSPVQAEATIWRMGGGIGGCGMLARYGEPGPGTITVERRTAPARGEDTPPITLVVVVDPQGRTVASEELTDQTADDASVTLTVPPGPAGIWRVSFEGGRAGDRVRFALPASPAWGVRGEMALGAVAGAPRDGWLWLPPGTGDVLISAPDGGATLTDAAGAVLPAVDEKTHFLWRWSHLPAGTAVRIAVAAGSRSVAIDGVPGLICPDAAAAADLRGGTVDVDGHLVEGPLQARARRWMLAAAKSDLDPHLVFPTEVPADLANPIAVLQLYGAYGPLPGLRRACATQVLDPADDAFGSLGGGDGGKTMHNTDRSPFDALGLAAAVAADLPLNPAHANRALATRATLLAFYHLARLQGDDLIREKDLAANNLYPITHAFFIYEGSLAGPLPLLQPYLDPAAAAIWRDGLIDAADRMGDYRGYQTNQCWHVVLAHLEAYRATGEPRFRRWFERQTRTLLARRPSDPGTFGQHAAGYFLEDGGPDGNYDAISGTCLINAWRDYRALPDADPGLVLLMHDALARDLAFTACHWLPQPDGSVVGPTAMMTRKVFSFPGQGWPGTRLARDEFPLASAQWQLTTPPATGLGVAELMPHFVDDDAWARRALEKFVPKGDNYFPDSKRGINAPWTAEAIRVACLPATAAATIPCRADAGTWDLPGQVAWKRGPLYGLTFWGVPGATVPAANCRFGGAPSALWTPSTGAFLLAQHNAHFEDAGAIGNNGVAAPDDLTWTCVYGRRADAWWWSGRERATFAWTKPDAAFRITGSAAAPAAPVTWDYELADGRLDLTVTAALVDLDAPVVSLPFLAQAADAAVTLDGAGNAHFTAWDGRVDIAWDGDQAATVSAPLTTGIPGVKSFPVKCLRIPLLRQGDAWGQHVRITVVK
jgi:hypothetical protein